jgi:hypothetical protein
MPKEYPYPDFSSVEASEGDAIIRHLANLKRKKRK